MAFPISGRKAARELLKLKGLCDKSGVVDSTYIKRPVHLLIPAAGRGTRLDYDGPKALYTLAGKPLLQIIHDKLQHLINSMTVVINPHHQHEFRRVLETLETRSELTFQQEPTGMGDAIMIGAGSSEIDNSDGDYLIVWGDQVTLDPQTVLICLLFHQIISPEAVITFPTCHMEQPYIHFGRDSRGRINSLSQRREGDEMPVKGENDTGVFIVRGDYLCEALRHFRKVSQTGGATGEFNFLPLIPWAVEQGSIVQALPVASQLETKGINTLEEADFVTRELGFG